MKEIKPTVPKKEATVESAPVTKKEAVLNDKNPSNWILTPLGDGTLRARNSKTNELFEGTLDEFNKALRA